jgi:xylulose-5-phosphate/fructose-6-phosphate phosphoketolase
VHANGAAFDNSDLICACVVGDGEAKTGPLPLYGIPTNS